MTSHAFASLLPIDHVIFNAGFDLPALAAFFERLGFTLTPLGRHVNGSVNRLVILRDCYLELIGLDPGTPPTVRPELQACPPSLNGIAFRGEPATQWDAPRLAMFNPVFDLQRPVDTDTVSGVARFRITTLRQPPRDFRLFLCSHLTPELLWHPPWMRHPNGVTDLSSVQVAAHDTVSLRAALDTVANLNRQPMQSTALSEGGRQISLLGADESHVVTLISNNLQATAQCLSRAHVPFDRNESGALRITVPGLKSTQLVIAGSANR